MVDGAASKWISIVSGVPQRSMLGPLLFILYTSEFFELVDNLPMQMTQHYRQLLTSQQTDMLLKPPLTGTWLEFSLGTITSA